MFLQGVEQEIFAEVPRPAGVVGGAALAGIGMGQGGGHQVVAEELA